MKDWTQLTEWENIDPEELEAEELEPLLGRLEEIYDELNAEEPDDEESDEYEEWLEMMEDLDSLMDDIRDRMEEERDS